jgi:hypothetical protein
VESGFSLLEGTNRGAGGQSASLLSTEMIMVDSVDIVVEFLLSGGVSDVKEFKLAVGEVQVYEQQFRMPESMFKDESTSECGDTASLRDNAD